MNLVLPSTFVEIGLQAGDHDRDHEDSPRVLCVTKAAEANAFVALAVS